jgi:hypothetical protein
MDESLHELEAELKALRPQQPSPLLRDRIGSELAAPGTAVADNPRYTSATNLNSWKWLGWRTAGIAAAVALVAAASWMNFGAGSAPGPAIPPVQVTRNDPVKPAARGSAAANDRYQPVTATNVLYDLKDEGQVYVDGDTPARRLRYRYLDTYTLKNPRTNASLKWSVPRDEIRVLPASLN